MKNLRFGFITRTMKGKHDGNVRHARRYASTIPTINGFAVIAENV